MMADAPIEAEFDRLAQALHKATAPVVMVSDSFQGGCVCENAAGLRLGTDNVEIAALCAPRPMILVGASGDWTAGLRFPS